MLEKETNKRTIRAAGLACGNRDVRLAAQLPALPLPSKTEHSRNFQHHTLSYKLLCNADSTTLPSHPLFTTSTVRSAVWLVRRADACSDRVLRSMVCGA